MKDGLLLRICFIHTKGATLGYIYGVETLDDLNLRSDNEGAGYRFLEVGNEITLMDEQYIINKIYLAIEPIFFDIKEPQYGISLTPSDEKRSYNATLNVFVDDKK